MNYVQDGSKHLIVWHFKWIECGFSFDIMLNFSFCRIFENLTFRARLPPLFGWTCTRLA